MWLGDGCSGLHRHATSIMFVFRQRMLSPAEAVHKVNENVLTDGVFPLIRGICEVCTAITLWEF